jgi:predicted DsbA family dithiol-disulfide isomerase
MSQTIKLNVWSDIACPWCYIGKRKLEAAIEQFHVKHPSAIFNVTYHSFFLNPEMPVDYEGTQREYLAEHKGLDLATVERMSERVTQIAASVGLNYDLEHQIMTNTSLAHLALHFAKAQGKQAEMKERLMSAHFVEAKHIGRLDDIVALGVEIGLNAAELREALTSGEYLNDVAADLQQAQAYGITGVPFFVIQDRFGISGAQDSSVFVDAFEQVLAADNNNANA